MNESYCNVNLPIVTPLNNHLVFISASQADQLFIKKKKTTSPLGVVYELWRYMAIYNDDINIVSKCQIIKKKTKNKRKGFMKTKLDNHKFINSTYQAQPSHHLREKL